MSMISEKVRFERKGDVALVTVVNPPVNALHVKVYEGLQASIKEAEADPSIKAVVLTGEGAAFIAGADIKAFGASFEEPEDDIRRNNREMNAVFDAIEDGSKPWVAAINGVALGGGLEFAMMCSHRVAVPTAAVGLPELQLGILPGLGGTQRLPRLIGVMNAVTAILQSQNIKAEKALKMGVVDKIVPKEQLLDSAFELARGLASGSVKRSYSLRRTDKLEQSVMVSQIISQAKQMAKKRSPHMPQAPAALRAIAAGVQGKDGREVEAAEFAGLAKNPVSKALIHLFLSQRACAKVKGVTDAGLKPRKIKAAGVIGGGLMGSGIATCLMQAGIRVVLKEINEKFLDAGVKRIRSNFQSQVKKGKLTEAKMEKVMGLLVPVLEYDLFSDVDIVIEAAIEKVDLKQQIFVELESICRPDCILASNTSTINIELIAAKTKALSRVIGAHFFSPAHVMPLLEIVVSSHTSPQVTVDLLELGRRIKKTSVVVGNCPGFAVNRTFFPYTMTAGLLVENGLSPYFVDEVVKGFGMPMGPFRLSDLVGGDVGKFVSAQYVEHFPERVYVAGFFDALGNDNRLGEKTGKGFYLYEKGSRKEKRDPELEQRVMRLAKSKKAAGLSKKDVVEAIFFPVINEATRILDEGFAQKASDLDIASVFGMGFPSHLGGPLHWADHLSAGYIHQRLSYFEKLFGEGIFTPSPYLTARAQAGIPLSATVQPRSEDDIVIVSAARTAIGRARRGGFNATPIDDLLKVVIKKVLDDTPQVKPDSVGDVVLGSVLGSMAATQIRTAMLMAGMPNTVPVRTINRQCSSGLQAIVDVAAAIKAGLYDVGIACGAESMSMNQMMPKEFKPNPNVLKDPSVASCYMPMGITSENVAAKFGITREVQDAFAAESHAKAARAIKQGKLNHIVPVKTKTVNPKTQEASDIVVSMDEGVREQTTVESLSKLKPAFKPGGSTTAGNASQTSDGAAAVLVMKRSKAHSLGLKPLATLRSYYAAGCDPAIMGIGPVVAIPGALDRAGVTKDDIEVFEVNEAFASQATYSVKKLGLPVERVNPNGGAIAIGHPLGMTGARMTVDIIHELQRRGGGLGVVSMCIGTGMGAAAVYEVEK